MEQEGMDDLKNEVLTGERAFDKLEESSKSPTQEHKKVRFSPAVTNAWMAKKMGQCPL